MFHNEQDFLFNFKRFFVPLTTKKVVSIIAILGFIVFFNSLFNGFLGDDLGQLLNNQAVHSINNIPKLFYGSTFDNGNSNNFTGIYYRPIMVSIFAFVYTFFGSNPFPYHLFQLSV